MQIQFPKYDFRFRNEGANAFIFDTVRKKYVTLTPEEWVRQHWIRYLIEEIKYPRSLIAIELPLKLNTLAKRCDIVLYGRNGSPQLIIECKSLNVKITQSVFDQIARYNLTLKVKFLIVSNGHEYFCCEIDFERGTYKFLESWPQLT